MPDLTLTRPAYRAILHAAAQAAPHECCGLLLGTRDARGVIVEEARAAANIAADPAAHFELDPQALFDALRAERAGGLCVLGYYHSHPNGRVGPSPRDESDAAGDGKIWAIAAQGDVTFWRSDSAGFTRLFYVIAGV
ncbi:M67 family metallopeptidase [Altericroceibacterium endophyticum]|uniref:M67 family metallopeptidase n=1 Tax=Altericroceibacterium endophyticum TaxID=1808508 RepID=UPI00301C1E35